MLVLSRKMGESLVIGEDIKITVIANRGNSVRIGIDAPAWLKVDREEVRERIHSEAVLDSSLSAK